MKTITLKNSGEHLSVGKIVCIGRNYVAHIEELGNERPKEPVIFLKPPSAMIDGGFPIIHPSFSEDMHHEVELVLLIGNMVKDADDKTAEEAIKGYGVGLDMTLRDIQSELKSKGLPWTIAKCFDTSAVVSDFILKEDYTVTLEEQIILSVNGEIRQNSHLKNMITKPAQLVKFISSRMTLLPGDLVFTGTPAGVGKVGKGDIIEAEIKNIAKLETRII